jgi:hypothetical protein
MLTVTIERARLQAEPPGAFFLPLSRLPGFAPEWHVSRVITGYAAHVCHSRPSSLFHDTSLTHSSVLFRTTLRFADTIEQKRLGRYFFILHRHVIASEEECSTLQNIGF